MMENGLNPACRVLTKLGGEIAVHEGTGIPRSALWRWQRPRERGGTGGRIPQARWSLLRAFARSQHVELGHEEMLGEDDLPDLDLTG